MFLFFGKDGQENVFDDVLERKHYENIDLQKSQNIFFSKGLVHGFGQKLAIFRSFYFSKKGKCIL